MKVPSILGCTWAIVVGIAAVQPHGGPQYTTVACTGETIYVAHVIEPLMALEARYRPDAVPHDLLGYPDAAVARLREQGVL
jgi:hypothetical protein